MLHAQLYFLFVFEARNLIVLFGVNQVLVLVLVLNNWVTLKCGDNFTDLPYDVTIQQRNNIANLCAFTLYHPTTSQMAKLLNYSSGRST